MALRCITRSSSSNASQTSIFSTRHISGSNPFSRSLRYYSCRHILHCLLGQPSLGQGSTDISTVILLALSSADNRSAATAALLPSLKLKKLGESKMGCTDTAMIFLGSGDIIVSGSFGLAICFNSRHVIVALFHFGTSPTPKKQSPLVTPPVSVGLVGEGRCVVYYVINCGSVR